jgi:hypothetical protein
LLGSGESQVTTTTTTSTTSTTTTTTAAPQETIMAQLPGFVPFGWPVGYPATGSIAFTSFSMNQAADAIEFIFQVPAGYAGGPVTRLGFRQNATTGTPPAYKIGLQGVDGSGNADGTYKGGGTPASAAFTPDAGVNGTFVWVTLNNAYTPSPGEMLAAVISYDSGTVDTSNFASLTHSATGVGTPTRPYVVTVDNAVRNRQTVLAVFGWGTATAAYGCPAAGTATVAVSSASSPDTVGIKFTLPENLCSAYTVVGVRLRAAVAVAGSVVMTLYAADGTTVLQQVTLDTDHVTGATAGIADFFFDEPTLAVLVPGQSYYLDFAPQTAATLTLMYFNFTSADDAAAVPLGAGWEYTSKVAGVRTDLAARRLMASPLIDSMGE